MGKVFWLVTGTIFLMELGDKTQLAAIGFASKYPPFWVYLGVVCGMALCTVISVLFGKAIATLFPPRYLKMLVGIIFIGTGVWTLISK